MIFVTGATGFVGSYLCRLLLKKGYKVRALKRETSDLSLLGQDKDNIEWVVGDVTDVTSLGDAMEGVEIVFHCAAYVGYDPKESARVFKINIEGTANVVNNALAKGVKKLIYVSSIAALGKDKKDGKIDENSKYQESKNNSIYGQSKYLAENEVWRGIAEGLNAVIVNPSLIIGAGKWNVSSVQVFSKIYNGVPFYSKGSSGYVDVRDVVEVMVKLMESEIINERFIINAENLTYLQSFGMIAKNYGKKPPFIPLYGFLSKLAIMGDWLKSKLTGSPQIITKELILLMQNTYDYDNSKVKKTLSYQFRPIEESIKETCLKLIESKKQGKNYAIFEV